MYKIISFRIRLIVMPQDNFLAPPRFGSVVDNMLFSHHNVELIVNFCNQE